MVLRIYGKDIMNACNNILMSVCVNVYISKKNKKTKKLKKTKKTKKEKNKKLKKQKTKN